jgi:hypothetical protein
MLEPEARSQSPVHSFPAPDGCCHGRGPGFDPWFFRTSAVSRYLKGRAATARRPLLANRRPRQPHELICYGKICSIILYSVRSGLRNQKFLLFRLLPRTLQPSEFVYRDSFPSCDQSQAGSLLASRLFIDEGTGENCSTVTRASICTDDAGVLHPVGGRVPTQRDRPVGGKGCL